MRQLEAGMACLIVGYKTSPRNLGKGCTLLEVIKSGSKFTAPNGKRYRAATDSDTWLCSGSSMLSSTGCSGWSLLAPQHLLPIQPDAKLEDDSYTTDPEKYVEELVDNTV